MACRFHVLSGLAILGLLVSACKAATYTVGDLAGWDISADLYSWPATKLFYIGDVLLFQYSPYHDVNQVDRNGFSNCNASNAMLKSTDGNTYVPLNATGDKYFICSVLSHCLGGMKLQVHVLTNVTAAIIPSPPSPPTSPPEFSKATP
ncbi:basic blue protein-like [Phalaenopsis equestris]|uniref:basic blue protein-like n=1 Tax=Phalaenopsis equestris TaxID=78828 RepID=UPI0009E3DCEA|nr:basic blue protein-like [Phalaenopsis equestris]